jgi:hypothetical protein
VDSDSGGWAVLCHFLRNRIVGIAPTESQHCRMGCNGQHDAVAQSRRAIERPSLRANEIRQGKETAESHWRGV